MSELSGYCLRDSEQQYKNLLTMLFYGQKSAVQKPVCVIRVTALAWAVLTALSAVFAEDKLRKRLLKMTR